MVCIPFYLILCVLSYIVYKVGKILLTQRKLDRWNATKCPKDLVVVHGVPSSKTIPCGCPFVLKLITFLKMAKIPYKYDSKDPYGPKGKTPWISLNGHHVADSQLCVEFLTKKYDVKIENMDFSAKDLAIANASRVLLEDRMFWEVILWGFVWKGLGPVTVQNFMKVPWFVVKYIGWLYNRAAWSQGMGRHSREDVEKWLYQDMKTISDILGNNKFLLGDEPCVEDATVFGFFAQFLWGFPAAHPYANLLDGEMKNVKEYCLRMKEEYYPDWDELLSKK